MSTRIEPEFLADLGEPKELQISPDGKQVVYTVQTWLVRKSENVQSALWIAEIGKEYSARPLTQDDFHNHSAKFSPDGERIAFLSDRAKPGKAYALYLLPLNGGEALPLTSKDNEMGVTFYEWSPDGKSIAYISADEKSEDRKQKEKDKDDAHVYDEDVDYAKLRVVDVETKDVRTPETVTPNRQGVSLAWNKDSGRIAYVTCKGPTIEELVCGNRIELVDLESRSSKSLCDWPLMIRDLCWQEDKLLWLGNYVDRFETSAGSVYTIDIHQAAKGYQRVAHGATDCATTLMHHDNKVVVAVAQGLTDILESLDGAELYRARRSFSSGDVNFSSSGTTFALAMGHTGTPTEVFSVVNGKVVQLSQHGKEMAEKKIGKAHLCEYTHEDGTPIDGFYAVPTALQSAFEENKPQKTVVVVHGGPYYRCNDRFDVFWHWTTFFMSLGYLVLVPNYRGGASHGHEYANAVRGDASQSYQDVIWLVKKGVEEKRIDPDYVAITGWSQGGFMSYLSVTRDDVFHFRAAVPGAGVSEWCTMALTSDIPTFEAALAGPAPWEMSDIHNIQSRKCSPLYNVRNVRTPVLIIHGERDARTPLEQAVGFYRGLKAHGKDVTMITYPREGHGLPVPWEKKHYIHMMERIEKFLKQHME